MRAPAFHDRQQRDLKIEMTPMIDVVFLLLVFFVWTASFRMIELVMPSEVSISSGSQQTDLDTPPPEELDFDNIVVRIKGDEKNVSWTINDEVVANVEALAERMNGISRLKKDAPVILHPDAKIAYGEVMRVYDLARLAGFDSVQIAASTRL
jgi:biopolymer transport protein ExbD